MAVLREQAVPVPSGTSMDAFEHLPLDIAIRILEEILSSDPIVSYVCTIYVPRFFARASIITKKKCV